ncbi:anhydro-N-acetylmuramic acid kinase [Solimicrobium silvestre]|uniref:Anhydro-N-acetylmuramic acid kinase n=1 Tax=Solimicrobium silvestre TaxID=2099400 RepID=A0A2S9GV10_9BURK|nr:anhydro-N-acetylmuramic acid kinase [Solimicrobium silvestre]PRC91565.1 putative molecular chaperone distantly related to HSP70-fold metalloprotease [Solimicrobium silvestre]
MRYYIGLMSGTSLDGVDGVLVEMGETDAQLKQLAASYVPFTTELRASLLSLQISGFDEIHRASQAANQLVLVYAECVLHLLKNTGLAPAQITAIGVHGQTVRHRPEYGYTLQINNPALLVELTGIDVIADFRSRDIAAGGQGAPLVPAFHRSIFGKQGETRVVANIGGISNISILRADGSTHGFDTGPGNVLMDAWIMQHKSQAYDANGDWARLGQVNSALLAQLLDEPFLRLAPPKSTGRDLFHLDWLNQKLSLFSEVSAVDVQATLCAFTAHSLADAITTYAPDVQSAYICGGGAYNATLMAVIESALNSHSTSVNVQSTEVLGVSPNHVEALAFAWLAYRHTEGLAGNLAEVTGAAGERILGALYPR